MTPIAAVSEPAVSTETETSHPAPALLRELAEGRPDALATVFHRYAPTVHRVAVALLLSADDADDVVQDVFIGLPEAIRHYKEEGAFEPWLKRVTARLALMKLRSSRRLTGDESLLLRAARPEPLIDRLTLESALGGLPPEMRLIVVLKVIAGFSHQEIAERLGLRRNTVEVRLFRALRKLKTVLSSSEES